MADTLTVADAFGDHVVEFRHGVDWYQLRRLLSGSSYEYRWRHHRATNWAGWRVVSINNVRGWADLPCKRVPITEAEQDPAGRWDRG